jgi:flagellar hook-associated protein 3 FlgL
MVTARLGDAAHATRISTLIQQVQARVRDTQAAAASGKASRSYSEIPASAAALVRGRDLQAQIRGLLAEADLVGDRLNAMDGALGAIANVADRMRSLVVNRLDGGTGQAVPLAGESRAALAEIAAQLNVRVDGRYLFAGSRTDTPPVVLPDPPPTVSDPDLYYRGDGVVLRLRTGPDTELAYGITAAEPTFALLISAVARAGEAHNSGDRAALETALGDLGRALDGLGELRGALGANAARLDAVREQQRGAALYLDEMRSRIEDVDLPEALTRLAADQALLEASYLALSRVQALSLADYLR